MKKLAFLLLLPVALLLPSCVHGGKGLKDTGPATYRGVVLHGSREATNSYGRYFKMVCENSPELVLGIEIDFFDSEEAQDRITVMMAAGDLCDFVLNWNHIDRVLTDAVKEMGLYRIPRLPEDYYRGLIAESYPFVIPLCASPYGLIYNRERLQRAGIEPAKMESWADLLAVFSKYVDATQEYPLLLPQNPEEPWLWYLFFAANLSPVLGPQGSSRFIQDLRGEHTTLNNPCFAEVIRRISQLRKFSDPQLSRSSFLEVFDKVAQGEAAFIFGHPFGSILSSAESTAVGFAPVPGRGEPAYFSAYPQHPILFLPTDVTAHRDRLDLFMAALLEDNALQVLCEPGMLFPPRSSVQLEGSPFYERAQAAIAERGELLLAMNQYELFQAGKAGGDGEDWVTLAESANSLCNALAAGELDPYSCLLQIDALFVGTAEPGPEALQAAVGPEFFREATEIDIPESQRRHEKVILQDTDQPRLVVLDFLHDEAVDSLQAAACGDAVEGELEKDGRFQVVGRDLRNAFLEQEGFSLSDCRDDSCLLRAGRLLGADWLVAGSILSSGEKTVIQLQLIDVESGERRGTASRSIETKTELIPSFKELARELFTH